MTPTPGQMAAEREALIQRLHKLQDWLKEIGEDWYEEAVGNAAAALSQAPVAVPDDFAAKLAEFIKHDAADFAREQFGDSAVESGFMDGLRHAAAMLTAAPAQAQRPAEGEPMHIGACLSDGKLHATVMQRQPGGSILVLATAEIAEDSLRRSDCHAVMAPATQPAEPSPQQRPAEGEPHPDDIAVDAFAAAMKEKLAQARAKGRGGWQTCPPDELSRMLREHIEKGDPRDVANFAMFLWSLGKPIAPATPAQAQRPADAGLGECDECGTAYSHDPTDGGSICVRCLKERLARVTQPAEPSDAELDALDTFALHAMAPDGRASVRRFARAVLEKFGGRNAG